jgi:hypothetical protein
MLLSFVSSKLLPGKVYVLVMLAFLIPASFLSIGIPQQQPDYLDYLTGEQAILLDAPFPFSFPVYASVVIERDVEVLYQYYRLFFLNYVLNDRMVVAAGNLGSVFFHFPAFYYVLYFSFFMLIDVFGAIIGYWLGKSAFIDRHLATLKQRIHKSE